MTKSVAALRRPELWQIYLVAAIAPLFAYPVLPAASRTLVFDCLAFASVGAGIAGLILFRPVPRLPWLLLLAGRCALVVGDLSWQILPHGAGRPFPTIPDGAYFAGYALIALGFAVLLVRRSLMPDWHTLLDAGVITSGLSILVWAVIVDRILSDPAYSAGGRQMVVAYAIADTMLVAVVASLLLAPSTAKPVVRLFAFSLAGLIVGEMSIAFFAFGDPTFWLGQVIQTVQLALWGAATLHPSVGDSPTVIKRRESRLTPRRLTALAAAALISPAVLILAGPGRDQIDYTFIAIGWVVTVGLVVACVAQMVREQNATVARHNELEMQFRDTAELLRAILDASPLGITVIDRNRHVRFWSRGAEAMFGFSPDEVVGRFPLIVARDEIPNFDPLVERCFAGKRVVESDLPRVTKAGIPVKIRAYMVPMRDETGEVWALMTLHEDMREIKQLEAELFEARKMESVGRLAGGIAHDFNNILTAIIGFADISLVEPDAGEVADHLAAIKSSAERAAGLTQQLLAFSRRQMLQPQVVDPNIVILSVEPMLRRLIGEPVALQIVTSPAAGSIRADPTQLQQVLLNLAINARDAMPDGGELVITTERHRIQPGDSDREVPPGEYATITVTDTGHGMDAETKSHIFEPFFTTKAKGRGTGLGLATTYGIVKQSGGSIHVDSVAGAGTTFVLRFPIAPGLPAEVPAEAAAPGHHSGLILLVEDEPVLRNLASRVLRRAGFEVVAAEDPIQAMALSEERRRDQIDLLLTDVVMPGMRGTELARRLQAVRPGLRVLLTSGYADEIVETDGFQGLFLPKPFTPDALLRAVEAALPELAAAS